MFFEYVRLYYVYGLKASNRQYVQDSLPNSLCRLLQISAKRSQLAYVPLLTYVKITNYPRDTLGLIYRPFQMRAWSCITSYPLQGLPYLAYDNVNPAVVNSMMLRSSMLAFEKVFSGWKTAQRKRWRRCWGRWPRWEEDRSLISSQKTLKKKKNCEPFFE